MKLRFKILIMCLGGTLLMLVLQAVLYQRTSAKLIYEQAKSTSETSLENLQNEIYTFNKNMESSMIEIYNEGDLIKALEQDMSISEMRKTFNREAFEVGTMTFGSDQKVLAYYIYNDDNEIVSTYRKAVTPKHNYPLDVFSDESYNGEALRQYVDSQETGLFISSYYNSYREKNVVRFALKISSNRRFDEMVGYVVCDVDVQVFQSIVERHINDEKMFVWLQPLGDRVMLSLGVQTTEEKENFEQISADIQNENLSEVNVRKEQWEFFQAEQNKYNVVAYSLMPQELLEQNQKTLTDNLLLIVLILIILSTVWSFILSRNITRPLERLMNTMQRIKEGETELRASVIHIDEIGKLGTSFNDMLDRIEELREKENQANLLLADSRYKALQAQINPHFLYNTLDTMSSIAEVMNCVEVSRMSQALANIFRYSLNMQEAFSTVSREMIHLKNYCYVMRVRMQDQISYEYQIDEAALPVSIPRMSIQPLVENSINHGLRNKKGGKEIRIEVKILDTRLSICVADNGVGMDAAAMNETLKKHDFEYVARGESIGIHNINARLKMLYGVEYGIYIESHEGAGTKVYMTIPYQQEERRENG